MKPLTSLLAITLAAGLPVTSADARGEFQRGEGDRQPASRGDKRSPMTATKMERPQPSPAARPAVQRPTKEMPATRPAPQPDRPTPRPAIQRPSVNPPSNYERPTTRPAPIVPNRPDLDRPTQRPEAKPAPLPAQRPDLTRPTQRPETKPAPLPAERPNLTRPTQRPETKPAPLPGQRPDFTRPSQRPDPSLPQTRPMPRPEYPQLNRPATLPGMVTYPSRPGKDRPVVVQRPVNNVYVDKININRRNTALNRPATLPANARPWNQNNWGGNHGIWGNNNNINVNINNNFYQNNNFSYQPAYWGARPWWGAGSCHTWHHGHWDYCYSTSYYHHHYYYNDSSFASGFMWGIAVWSLGNMIYDMGYQSYRNPYPAPPVRSTDAKSTISYSEPITVTAATRPPGDEKATVLAETQSSAATEASRAAFKRSDYLAALKSADEAIAYTPGDVTLHEYRALILFALGRFSDAAGVLNPVLASGPGWGWETMVGFYDSTTTYSAQLRKLETYVNGGGDAADIRFLLGYHYLVCGHLEKAYEQFEAASKLQPADSISRQLRDLTRSSLPAAEDAEPPAPAPPAPIPADKLVGTWTSDRGADGKVVFTMEPSGDYTWSFLKGSESKLMTGTYGLNDKGLLVLTSTDSQLVSAVTLENDSKLKFVLVGAPKGDPGMDFTKG